jgi:hypothetical protein
MTTQFLTRAEAAALMGLATKTLSNWTARGYGPKVYNPTGGRALYKEQEVVAFIEGTPVVTQAVFSAKRGRGRPPKHVGLRTA